MSRKRGRGYSSFTYTDRAYSTTQGVHLNDRPYEATARTSKSKPRGQFVDRIWHCDCTPRLPAEHFRVKKEGPNKGRWFYTCQKAQEERCGFFLWDEDAEPRMQAALLHGGGSEQESGADGAQQQAVQQQQPSQSMRPPPPVYAQQDKPNGMFNPRKRTLPWANEAELQDDSETDSESEDTPLPWPSTADDHPTSQYPNNDISPPPPSTPHKAQKTSLHASPGGHSGAENGLVTPQTGHRASLLQPQAQAQAQTPTPARFHDAASAPTTPSKPGNDITNTVLSYLSTCRTQLSPDNTAGLRAILETYRQQVRGITKGRDIARDAVKAKDGRIAELAGRVQALEGDLELYRARVRTLKEEVEGSQESKLGES